ncbi:MAG TPA: AarF/ABC1/UbiB kinase family protein [Solirubrobacteraceae bacterium]|nr:AarF/ABC1/UbiB kinase family protein [Solirubrobacteraceae bacterium]
MSNGEGPSRTNGVSGSEEEAPKGRVRRVSSLAGLTARTAGEAIAIGLRTKATGTGDPEFHERTAERYAMLLGRSKGVLMKAGQMLSFMADTPLASAEIQSVYQTALSRLNSNAPPMSAELAREVLERDLGRPAKQAFAELDWNPLAAASIGQVHAGRLHDGRAVAVKIQYPGAAQAIRSDLRNVELLATFFSLAFGIFPRLSFDLRAAADELGRRITEELDYRREAANQTEFARHYRGHPFIHVPEVVHELSTDRVLTQELASGRNWSEALESPAELRDQWGETIYRFAYGSFARLGVVHADPHPGNFIFHENGSVSFLDFGCVKRFSPAQIEACRATFRAAYLDNDPLRTWRAGTKAGLWGASDAIPPEEMFLVWREMRGYLLEEQPLTITPAHVTKCFDCRFANAVRHMTASAEYTVMPRIEIGTLSLLAQLRATNDWQAVGGSELFDLERPSLTAMGRRHLAFFQRYSAREASR